MSVSAGVSPLPLRRRRGFCGWEICWRERGGGRTDVASVFGGIKNGFQLLKKVLLTSVW